MSTHEKETAASVEDVGVAYEKAGFEDLDEAAADGTRVEKELTVRQAFSYYRKSVMWCVIMSMAVIMESYDLMIVNSFFAYPTFQQRFGIRLPNGTYSIPANWQMGLSLGSTTGLIIGAYANGILSDRFGPRKVMMGGLVALAGFVFITFFAQSLATLLVGELLCGIPCGIFSVLIPGYAAEVTPMKLRGYLTSYINICWVVGHMLAAGVLKGLLSNPTQWGWRIPFALQWMWPSPLLIAAFFAPESPWWLVKKDRIEEAEMVLKRLVSAPAGVINTKDTVAMMVHTIRYERSLQIGTSFRQCFQGTNLRRTEIAIMTWGCAGLTGFAIQGYITYFFTLAGLSPNDSFKLALGNYSIAFVGTASSWFTQTRFGRRTIYITGLCFMLPTMWIVGFLELAPASSGSTIKWVQSAFLLCWFFFYGATVGPIPYIIAAEVGASQLRAKTISVSRNTYYFFAVIITVSTPYMLNPANANLKGKAAFPAGVCMLVLLVWAYFRLPETKDLTPEDLDVLFERRVSARKFKEEGKKL